MEGDILPDPGQISCTQRKFVCILSLYNGSASFGDDGGGGGVSAYTSKL